MRSLLFFAVLSSSLVSFAKPELPKELKDVGVSEHMGSQVDMNTSFTNEEGQEVALKDYIKGNRPVIVALGYNGCPKLCSLIWKGFVSAARSITWTIGKEYDFVMISIDPREDHLLAAQKKENVARSYGRDGAEKGFHFLTGTEANIQKMAQNLGVNYKYDKNIDQYAHPAVLMVVSPGGKITRYLYGIEFRPNDLKLALIEGAEGRVGTVLERALLFCYQYDATSGSYSVTIMNMMKILAAGTIVMIALLVWFLRRQTRRQAVQVPVAQKEGLKV